MNIITEDFNTIEKTYAHELEIHRGKTILVTGAYGMITSYLCRFLIHIMDKLNLNLYLQGNSRNPMKCMRRVVVAYIF